ncbi:hypothetical protein J1TS5_23950 [Paenibacillus macerans]|uniref:hypothetical protein n=1 Tax=Paenibacillus macerans TaxID=44252 RepID=UPI001B1489CF|nr:hypothetical protein [Paenibacillus macerans]GIP10225.1 hypothetical protein J1TS5_23950 [Paenibacillus macerans]
MRFDTIEQLKKEPDAVRPFPPAAVKNLDEVYRIEWTYNSNAIEGNTLPLLETKLVLEEGLTIGGKKLREHFEVVNHSEAIDYVNRIRTTANRGNIMRTEDQIKRKLYELKQLSAKRANDPVVQAQIEMLEWVLNQPIEKYHV